MLSPAYARADTWNATAGISFSETYSSVKDMDPEDNPVSCTLTNGPAGMNLLQNGQGLTYSWANPQPGTYSIETECVSQYLNGVQTRKVFSDVLNVANTSPSISQDQANPSEIKENTTATLKYTCTDPDGNLKTCTASSTESFVSCSSSETIPGKEMQVSCSVSPGYEEITGSGDPSLTKKFSITVSADDGFSPLSQTYESVIRNVNRPPYFTTTPPLYNPNQYGQSVFRIYDTYYYDADAVDPDGDSLGYNIRDGPYNLLVDHITGEIGGHILETGNFCLRIDVSDNYSGGYDTQYHCFTVNP